MELDDLNHKLAGQSQSTQHFHIQTVKVRQKQYDNVIFSQSLHPN